MDVVRVVDAWIGFVAAVAVLWILWSAWPSLLVGYVRQRLFEIRDSLFDQAAQGKLAFDSREYRVARDVLNSMIRNAEHATVWRYAAYAALIKRHGATEMVSEVGALLNGRDAPEPIRMGFKAANRLYDKLLIGRSPALLLVFVVLWLTRQLARRLARSLAPTWWNIESDLKQRRSAAISADVSADLDRRNWASA